MKETTAQTHKVLISHPCSQKSTEDRKKLTFVEKSNIFDEDWKSSLENNHYLLKITVFPFLLLLVLILLFLFDVDWPTAKTAGL